MSLERILYILSEINGVDQNDFNVNNSECVLGIGKGISSLLYDPEKQKPKSRLLFMKLLKDLCLHKNDHFDIGEESCEVYLDSLNFPIDDFQGSHVDDEWPQSNEILDYFDSELRKQSSKQKRLEFINGQDRKAFEDDFDFTPLKTVEYHTDNNELCTGLIARKEIAKKSAIDDIAGRQTQVDFAYAVMNLQVPKADNILRRLLMKWKSMELRLFEKQFIKVYFGREFDGRGNLIELFKFVYEEPLIEIATQLLTDSRPASNLNDDKRIVYLRSLMKLYPHVRLDIISISFELFALSNYSSNVYELVNCLRG